MLHSLRCMSSIEYFKTQKSEFEFAQSNDRIIHFRIKKNWELHHFLEMHLECTGVNYQFLLSLGAVYLNNQRVENLNSPIQLNENDYLRVHLCPRRFLINGSKIHDKILYENNEFIIFKKDHGEPCHPTLDNKIENILYQLKLFQQIQNLYLCHRLDVGTAGLLIIAKSVNIQNEFMNNWKNVEKIYSASTSGPTLKLGLLEHWMRPHPRAPKILSSEFVEKWQLCHLEILKNEKIDLLFNKYEIKLVTGRTHQIRAQLSFECNPILGDHLYQSPYHLENKDHFMLVCNILRFNFRNIHYEFNYTK